MTKSTEFLKKLMNPFRSHRSNRARKGDEEDLEAIAAKEQKVFRYETLVSATRNFSLKNKLGEGGFGPVFKGQLLDGREVAVKKLGAASRQGAKEFQNEAMLLSRVQHRNVVNLYGYCTHGDDKLLVYEYVTNESLDKLLFASVRGSGDESRQLAASRAELNWHRRYDVIMGIARGLLYLHEDAHTPIIHRDIKASNILLDDRWCPKIADFGMARLYPEGQTHVNTRVAGTNGYMAPEYLMHGSLSTKADVFSFGVLVLELVSGQKNSSFAPPVGFDAQNLLEWAWRLYKKGQSEQMLDPALKHSAVLDQVAVCVQIGLLCTQADPKLRPDMKRVVVILSKKPSHLEEPSRPGITGSRYRRRAYGSGGESSTNTNLSETSTSTPTCSASGSTSMANNTATASSSHATRRSRGSGSRQEDVYTEK
ncbi:cysteine-rich receptor-like protein kinase 10 isoform X1 [Carex littledalei]|uniref:Cysteine-rich receptor-like protein kinase 10 isoform X1 n=1 Tax=Carex littledalei TaxID=544730 RepID=A0A833QRJ1_9POAL|nr:cysteine-rich receptor-like protein kinase 10 isoform X1 [Carex littledalei]